MNIHFIGIGGIGVSALAQYYLAKGDKISGSDLQESEITESLKKLGAKIFIGPHSTRNVLVLIEVDLVVYSPAVQPDNPELREAKKRKIKCLSYPEALGKLTKEHFTIAVCGTHGKSTTTAMIGLLLGKAGLNPTVIIGTKLKEFGNSNFRMGGEPNSKFQIPNSNQIKNQKSKILVIEADEHFASFLNYWPKIIVLTTIEKDHLDYYKNLKNILKAFREFISHLPKDGILVANKDDKNIKKIKNRVLQQQNEMEEENEVLFAHQKSKIKKEIKIKNYSLKQPEAKKLKEILKVPGEHNIQNALAALTVARILKIPDKVSFKALSEYQGAWRRFEVFKTKLNNKPYVLISDYGHHPTEVRATLKAAREKFPKQRIILIFQPHQYQRTKLLFNDFVKSFDEADILILNEIYGVAGREQGKIVSSKDLAEAVKKRWNKKRKKSVVFIKDMKDISEFLAKILKPNDVVIVMGAGDIYNLFLRLHQRK